MGLAYVISWEHEKPASIQRKCSRCVLRSCCRHQKENVFLHLSIIPEGKKPFFPPSQSCFLLRGKHVLRQGPICQMAFSSFHYLIFHWIVFVQEGKFCAVICVHLFDFWLYKCKYDCEMVTNMCKRRILFWRRRTFNFFENKQLLSVGTVQVLCLQSLRKQFREPKDVGCLRKNKSEWTCPKDGHHRGVRTLFSLRWLPRPVGPHRFVSVSAWLSDPSLVFFNEPGLDETCSPRVHKERKHVVFLPFLA